MGADVALIVLPSLEGRVARVASQTRGLHIEGGSAMVQSSSPA